MRTLLSSRRQSQILQTVRLRGACSVGELASQLGVSDETIRRHVRPLVHEGLVRKVHGGIMLPDRFQEPPFERRMLEQRQAKQRIAALAASRISDGDSLMMDTGSTTAYVALALANHGNLLVVTNCVEIARSLATRNGNRVYMAGGELRSDDAAAFGVETCDFFRRFSVDHAILSIGAIDADGEFMDFHLCEGELARTLISRAKRTMVVADHTKLGRRAPIRVCSAADVASLVTDLPLSAEHMARFGAAGTEVLVADAPEARAQATAGRR